MVLTKELFVIPHGNNYILYAPLKGIIVEVNSSVLKLLKNINDNEFILENPLQNQLISYGIIEKEPNKEFSFPKTDFLPSSVTIFPTSDCNLRCQYCYASAGETKYLLKYEAAKAAIDFILQNAIKKRLKKINIGFHGGGEPFYGPSYFLVKKIVKYAKKVAKTNNLEIFISSATNGILTKEQLIWISENFNRLTLSIDGPKEIHDYQRPSLNGRSSYDYIRKSIEFFESKNFSYGIRATISTLNCNKMIEMIDDFRSISSTKQYHFEPLFECGRCSTTKIKAPNQSEYIKNIEEAIQYAEKFGITIHYSGSRINYLTNKFCGALGKNFCITPQGYISSCYEVNLDSDTRSEFFFYGTFDNKTNNIQIDYNKLEKLQNRTIEKLSFCNDCFIKYQCAGDCAAKVMSLKNIYDTSSNLRCDINRSLSLTRLIKSLRTEKLLDNK